MNSMRNLGEEIKYSSIIERVLISLSPKLESNVSTIEEMQDLKSITLDQLHRILTTFEMKKGGPSDMREGRIRLCIRRRRRSKLCKETLSM